MDTAELVKLYVYNLEYKSIITFIHCIITPKLTAHHNLE